MLRLSARNPEQEEAVEEVAIEYSGDSVDIGFNVSYLRDALAAVESETVEIGLSNKDTGCVIRAPGDERIQYVVMPMRI
jgi:DNA polymerase-3 subunit beta